MKNPFCCPRKVDSQKVTVTVKNNCCNRKKLVYSFAPNETPDQTDKILRQIKIMLNLLND